MAQRPKNRQVSQKLPGKATTLVARHSVAHHLSRVVYRSGLPVRLMVVGCGGTGSTFVAGLPYLHQALQAKGLPGLHVTVVDGDVVSPANCVRQPFNTNDVGHPKATRLVAKLNMFWGLNWDSIPRYFQTDDANTDFLVSCVDTRKARNQIYKAWKQRPSWYYLDFGNDANTGQFILGAEDLPTAPELFPEIIDPALDSDDVPSCSALEALMKQHPFINQVLAQQGLALLSQLLWNGVIHYHGGFVNLQTGVCTPLPIREQENN